MPRRRRVSPSGFSLVELTIACCIAALVALGVVGMVVMFSRAYRTNNLVRELQENARFAVDAISRDVRMAGYGIGVRDSDLRLWIPWVDGLTNNPTIVQGASASSPDAIHIVAAFDSPVATLASAAAAGAGFVDLAYGQGAQFNTTNRSVVYIGRAETARIVSVSGDRLNISAHPTQAGVGLTYAHPAGTPVELVKVVTYAVRSPANVYPGQPYLARDDHTQAFSQPWQAMAAGQIEDLQFIPKPYSLSVRLTGRTAETIPGYRDPERGDGYRRLRLDTEVIPRNSFRRRY